MFIGILFFIFSVLAISLGILVWKKKKLSLVKGYDIASIRDKDGLSAWFGKCFITLGALSSIFGIFIVTTYGSLIAIIVSILSFMVITRIGFAIVFLGVERYK